MVENSSSTSGSVMAEPISQNKRQNEKRGPPLNQIYVLPAPIKTFPLPAFVPNNPLSLFHVAYVWLGQLFSPPPAEPSVTYQALWSAATTSVHVTDTMSMRALWEQGFYGKGNLSRSEPNWLKREQVRRGLEEGHVSEIHTVERREERIRAKWERARLEQEAIRQTREDEARQALRGRQAITSVKPSAPPIAEPGLLVADLTPPVGPLQLLRLPNSASELLAWTNVSNSSSSPFKAVLCAPVGPLEILALPNSKIDLLERLNGTLLSSGKRPPIGLSIDVDGQIPQGALSDGDESTAPLLPRVIPGLHALKRRKSVRFSSKVDETTFQTSDPPSPSHSVRNDGSPPPVSNEEAQNEPVVIVNKEHLQLMPEEALWLKFGMGVLDVIDPDTGKDLSSAELLTLFRQHCYYPPRTGPDDPDLQPDDNFLVHYAVYHHFRSLGWVPRAGIKFGVDWLLYTRGPVFDHAEFGLIVIPSYTDPWWKQSGRIPPQKTWHWLHSIVRVLSHVMKSLVLVYVDIPPPQAFDEHLESGFAEALKLYQVREVMVKRWSSNRNR